MSQSLALSSAPHHSRDRHHAVQRPGLQGGRPGTLGHHRPLHHHRTSPRSRSLEVRRRRRRRRDLGDTAADDHGHHYWPPCGRRGGLATGEEALAVSVHSHADGCGDCGCDGTFYQSPRRTRRRRRLERPDAATHPTHTHTHAAAAAATTTIALDHRGPATYLPPPPIRFGTRSTRRLTRSRMLSSLARSV